MPPESNDNRFFLDRKDSRLGFLGACREISDGLTLLPLRDSLLVDPVAPGEGTQVLLAILYLRPRPVAGRYWRISGRQAPLTKPAHLRGHGRDRPLLFEAIASTEV